MRIAVIASLYTPHTRGGAEVIAERVVHGLARAGHEVFVITTSPHRDHHEPHVEVIDGIRVFRFYPKNIFSFIHINAQPAWKRAVFALFDLFNMHSYGVVKRLLHEHTPDLVLTHNLKGIGYTIPRAIRSLGIRHIHTIHDVQLVVPSGQLVLGKERAARMNFGYPAVCRWLFGSPDVIVSPSAWLLQFYEYLNFFPASKKVILPNPVDPDLSSCAKTLDPKRVHYAYIGQLESHKGIELLLSAFNEFAHRNGSAHLIVAGTGSLYDNLRFKYADSPYISLLGYVPTAQLCARVYAHAHYTVVPTLCYENSPGTIYDSMASGTPVIASDIGGTAELIKHSEVGYLIEPGNRFELMKALEISADQAAHSPELGERARMYMEQFYTDGYCTRLLES